MPAATGLSQREGKSNVLTEYLKVDVNDENSWEIIRAAQLLSESEVVAFPTETVYGVGAKVFDEAAVGKIFIAKNRRPDQSLLVHISQIEQVYGIAAEVTDDALLLMKSFWPGPLSIILPADSMVPLAVTGGKDTVGLRMPAHPVAKKLIDITGPLAATSANLSGRPSPLTAQHVKEDLDGHIAAIVDAGPTGLGIESTIIDISKKPYTLLRLGGIQNQEIEAVLNQTITNCLPDPAARKYQTSSKVIITSDWDDFLTKLEVFKDKSLGMVAYDQQTMDAESRLSRFQFKKRYILSLEQQHSNYFSILRDAEQNHIEIIIFTPLPDTVSFSLRDRINRSLYIAGQGE